MLINIDNLRRISIPDRIVELSNIHPDGEESKMLKELNKVINKIRESEEELLLLVQNNPVSIRPEEVLNSSRDVDKP